ncbi:MinD/ParA family protein [Gordonia oryzae]|uniref:MinD/ParA family protein n=1 Tax=Gordonia oryzae TaxID=2487349 RepID=A0A3N4G5G4_9ACTN|nr:MinD/ParA family protein [Gordonia oryzae]RPA58083.1 MinD/ParA family protein [Gordonia oryzae]
MFADDHEESQTPAWLSGSPEDDANTVGNKRYHTKSATGDAASETDSTPGANASPTAAAASPRDNPASADFNPFAGILGGASPLRSTGLGYTGDVDDDNPLLAAFGARSGVTAVTEETAPSKSSPRQTLLPSEDDLGLGAMWMPLASPEGETTEPDEPQTDAHTDGPHDAAGGPGEAAADSDDLDEIEARAAQLLSRLGRTQPEPAPHPEFTIPTLSHEPIDELSHDVPIVADDPPFPTDNDIRDGAIPEYDEASTDSAYLTDDEIPATADSPTPINTGPPTLPADTRGGASSEDSNDTDPHAADAITVRHPTMSRHPQPTPVPAPTTEPRRRRRPARPPWQQVPHVGMAAPPSDPTASGSIPTGLKAQVPIQHVPMEYGPANNGPTNPEPVDQRPTSAAPPRAPAVEPRAEQMPVTPVPYPAAPQTSAPQTATAQPFPPQHSAPQHSAPHPAPPITDPLAPHPRHSEPTPQAPSAPPAPAHQPPSSPWPGHRPPAHQAPAPPPAQHFSGQDPAPQYAPASPYAPAPPFAPGPAPAHPSNPLRPPTAVPSLDEAHQPDRRSEAPQAGWRRAVFTVSSGHVNPGESRAARRRQQLLDQIRRPINGDFRIAMLSMKGGVGKTTTTVGLGSALAAVRGDRVIAVDANPDRGTLADRIPGRTSANVRDLLNMGPIDHYAAVSNLTSTSPSRLEVLASEQDPAAATAYDEADYRRTIDMLQRYYNIILTDCGTGIMHSVMGGVLDLAHAIVLVTTPAMDAARSASATLDWLNSHGYGRLVREAHVVLSSSRPQTGQVKVDKIVDHFAARCDSIHMIPFDQHLAEGAAIDFTHLRAPTQQAFLELAANVSNSFGMVRRHPEIRYRRMEV